MQPFAKLDSNLAKSTVHYIIKKNENFKSVENIPKKGRPPKLPPTQNRFILKEVDNNPRLLAPKLKEEVESKFGITVSSDTINRTLRKAQ